jgi:uncharacterized protein YbaA (DUF1428 family)
MDNTPSSTRTYTDGFITPVPTAKREEYRLHAEKFAPLFKQHGALRVVECWGDDVPEGKLTSFTMAVKRQDDESIVFSWIQWPSKAVRDEAWKKLMADPLMQPGAMSPPFDGKRLIYGGFEVLLDL